MIVRELGDAVTFYQRYFKTAWWTSVIQSYARLTTFRSRGSRVFEGSLPQGRVREMRRKGEE